MESVPDEAGESRFEELTQSRPDDNQRPVPRWVVISLVLLSTAFVMVFMLGIWGRVQERSESFFAFPSLLIANTPTGGDLGAHVLLPSTLRESILPSGRLLGWSNDWYGGFPVLYFYFPLTMLAIVVADLLIPYGVAIKIVASAGLVALPGAAFFLLRRMGYAPVIASVGAAGAAGFVFMESYAIYGGNIKSVLAGEFSFSWSLALGLVYLGLLIGDADQSRGFRPLPGVMLALVTLTHVVSTIVFVVASVLLLHRRGSRQSVVGSWALGFGLSAFWALPFSVGVLSGLTTDLRWEPVTNVVGSDSPLPLEFVPVLVVAAATVWWFARRSAWPVVVVGIGILPLIGYALGPTLGISAVNNGRFLPYWFLAVHLVAATGLAIVVVKAGRRIWTKLNGAAVAASLLVAVIAVFVLGKMVAVPGFVEWSWTGYEGRDDYDEYAAVMEIVDELEPGRILWEDDDRINRYGTIIALMLFPYWSEGHPSMAGLYNESSLATPFNMLNSSELSAEGRRQIQGLNYHGLDPARGMRHLDVYGVRYYVTSTDEAEMAALDAGLRPLATSDPWVIFPASNGELVTAATSEPAVWGGSAGFVDAALEWYDDVDNLDRWIVANGPEGWRRIASVGERLDFPEKEYSISEAAVSDVVVDDHRISFTTNAVGVPHMIKVSYFPNWKAEGADGPYRAAPSLMVVIPTSEDVELTFERTWVEHFGNGLSFVTLAGLVVWWLWSRRFKRPTGSTAIAEIGVSE